jgi:hypothetical protein
MDSDRSPHARQLREVVAPLEKEEERRAMAAAVAQLERPQERRFRVLGAELLVEKPRQPDALPERRIDVIVVDYDGRQILEVLVDANGEVVGREQLGYQPAFDPDEVDEADAIAKQDPRVARLTQQPEVLVSTFVPVVDAELGVRLVGLRYAIVESDEVRFLADVGVDLCARAVVEFEAMGTAGESGG